MFEKSSNLGTDSAGSSGEYTVQAGLGWTNAVVLWVTSTYGGVLNTPKCLNIIDNAAQSEHSSESSKAVPLPVLFPRQISSFSQ